MEDDSRACLSDSFREMSDQELLERWSGGYLTEIAVEVARKELTRRGIHPPPYVAKVPDNLAVDEAEPSELAEVARSQVNVELEVLGARLSAEGIPSLIVNANSNRMGPQFSNAAGGSRLLVASQYEKDAKQIIALVKAGAFALKEGDDVG